MKKIKKASKPEQLGLSSSIHEYVNPACTYAFVRLVAHGYWKCQISHLSMSRSWKVEVIGCDAHNDPFQFKRRCEESCIGKKPMNILASWSQSYMTVRYLQKRLDKRNTIESGHDINLEDYIT